MAVAEGGGVIPGGMLDSVDVGELEVTIGVEERAVARGPEEIVEA